MSALARKQVSQAFVGLAALAACEAPATGPMSPAGERIQLSEAIDTALAEPDVGTLLFELEQRGCAIDLDSAEHIDTTETGEQYLLVLRTVCDDESGRRISSLMAAVDGTPDLRFVTAALVPLITLEGEETVDLERFVGLTIDENGSLVEEEAIAWTMRVETYNSTIPSAGATARVESSGERFLASRVASTVAHATQPAPGGAAADEPLASTPCRDCQAKFITTLMSLYNNEYCSWAFFEGLWVVSSLSSFASLGADAPIKIYITAAGVVGCATVQVAVLGYLLTKTGHVAIQSTCRQSCSSAPRCWSNGACSDACRAPDDCDYEHCSRDPEGVFTCCAETSGFPVWNGSDCLPPDGVHHRQ